MQGIGAAVTFALFHSLAVGSSCCALLLTANRVTANKRFKSVRYLERLISKVRGSYGCWRLNRELTRAEDFRLSRCQAWFRCPFRLDCYVKSDILFRFKYYPGSVLLVKVGAIIVDFKLFFIPQILLDPLSIYPIYINLVIYNNFLKLRLTDLVRMNENCFENRCLEQTVSYNIV